MSVIDQVYQAKQLAEAIASALPSIVGCASMAAAFLPPPKEKGVLARVHKAINTVAFNFKHAANQNEQS